MSIDTRGEIDATLTPIELSCNWQLVELSVGDIMALLFTLAIIAAFIVYILQTQNII